MYQPHTQAIPDFDLDETSYRFTHISAPTRPTNQSTNDTVHQISAPIQPPQTNPPTTPSTPTDTTHTPQIPHTLHRYHTHTAPQTPTTIRSHPRDAGPPTLTPTHSTLSTHPALTHPQFDRPVTGQDQAMTCDSTGQASDRIRLNQARLDQNRLGQVRPSQASPLTPHRTRPASGLRKFFLQTRPQINPRRCRRC